jgi:hypothetical protein
MWVLVWAVVCGEQRCHRQQWSQLRRPAAAPPGPAHQEVTVNRIRFVRRTLARRASPPGTGEPHSRQPNDQESHLVSRAGSDGLAGRFLQHAAAGASVTASQNRPAPTATNSRLRTITTPRLLLTLLLAAGATSAVAQPASASTPIPAAGTFFFVAAPVPSDFRMAGGNTFVTLFFPAGVLTGDITGTFTEQLRVVTHSDGSQNVHGNATCTCAVAGRTGVLVFDNIAGTTSPSGVGNAHFVLSGSGGLADLHGQGTAIITPTPRGPFGAYTAQYSFGP